MNEKLALQDLVEILSKRAKITKKDADLFFRELFQLILDHIFENDSVKIKDFGTFKLTSVSSRESVNVNTGAKIEIPAHFKLSFLPDKTLKDLVNKPFSQFETILLEDGTIADSIDPDIDQDDDLMSFHNENEENELVDELADAENDSNSEDTNSDYNSENKIQETTIDVEPANVAKGKVSPVSPMRINNPYPLNTFVYTYTSSSNDNEIITLTLPKEEFDIASDIQNSNIEEIELKSNAAEINSTTESGNEISNEVIVNNKHIDVIEELDLGHESEIETEEDVIMVPSIAPKKEVDIRGLSSESSSSSNSKNISNIDDPERPLVPLDESMDEIESDRDFILEQEGSSIYTNPLKYKSGNNKPVETRNVVYSDAIEDIDNIPYYDYNKSTFGSLLIKKLPIIIFILAIVCFTIYGFIKLFDVHYDYEYYLGNKNFTLADTLPLVNEKSDVVTLSSDTLSTSTNIIGDTVKTTDSLSQLADKKEAVSPNNLNVTPIAQPNIKNTVKSGRIISDKLHIDILNKGAFHVNRRPELDVNEDTESKSDKSVKIGTSTVEQQPAIIASEKTPSKSVYVVMQRGTTLRTMATKYYGNASYWVYIYQANRTKLSNPNDISVGMKILIPDLANYGVTDPKNSKEIQKAKNLEDKLLRW